jgi:hypothetical protein
MKTKPRVEELLWMGAGAVLLAVVLFVGWHLRGGESPAEALAMKATRVDLVGRMELALARASEAEKSAVLATTDIDAQRFADEARTATREVESERAELEALSSKSGTGRERDLLGKFSGFFTDLKRVDDQVLGLAVKDTNLKAYALAFGPAMERATEMEGALDRVAAKGTGSPDAREFLRLALGAKVAVLQIQAMLPPHIAEESDAKMDEMEASMKMSESAAQEDLDGLAALPKMKADPDLERAISAFARYGELKKKILALSRENTNVRSLALSLNEKRKAMTVCLDALASLKSVILEEPIPGVSYGRPAMLK